MFFIDILITLCWYITISNLNDHRQYRESWKCKQFHINFSESLLVQSVLTDGNPSYVDVAVRRLDGVDDVLTELLSVQSGYPGLPYILSGDTVITCTVQLSTAKCQLETLLCWDTVEARQECKISVNLLWPCLWCGTKYYKLSGFESLI